MSSRDISFFNVGNYDEILSFKNLDRGMTYGGSTTRQVSNKSQLPGGGTLWKSPAGRPLGARTRGTVSGRSRYLYLPKTNIKHVLYFILQ